MGVRRFEDKVEKVQFQRRKRDYARVGCRAKLNNQLPCIFVHGCLFTLIESEQGSSSLCLIVGS